MNRKTFINNTLAALTGITLLPKVKAHAKAPIGDTSSTPLIISTWPFGMNYPAASSGVSKEG